ncbi:restriction endonuclease subunit S [Xenorhabdus sp. PB30.3]|uniref:restriction endonuclease subunit S n=1 Tax=Xenorhabdus sp. PB30.3 TaxID=2788941 RepID=UPI001E635C28|nr:restriction endonuclease subunit S [Xenorhabdus sp. PB30.3]MCC8380336.1 restriction endonuclease subunit S [Xenorhabdus sp. PB30.3]
MSKQAKKALVPELRFPEFQNANEWKIKPFERSFTRITTKNSEKNQNILTISAQKGLISQLEYFNKTVASKDVSGYYLLHKGDFAYNKSYSQGYPMGAIKSLKDYEKGVVSTLYICFKAKTGYNPSFFEQYFDAGILNSELKKIAQEGGRNHGLLNVSVKEFFKNINIVVPTPEEQQKIAGCLSSIDELITVQTQKLDTLKNHKKGLMQQLFPAEGETVPKLRFTEFKDSGSWEKSTLGNKNISIFVKERVPLNKIKLEDYISTENLLPDYAGITIASKLPATGSFTWFKKNDILVSNIRPYLKKVWSASKDGASSNDVIIIRSQSKISESFLSFLLKNDEFINYIMKGAKGVKMPRGDISLIKEFPVTFPKNKEEQQKIVNCLSSIDELITVLAQKITVIKDHKKGLMQQLFPSIEEGEK